MAGETTPVDSNPAATLAALLSQLGGMKSTSKETSSTSADTSGLDAVLAQLLAQQDGGSQIAAILQQANTAAPQLTRQLANSAGARTGKNSALQGAMSKVLTDALTQAQNQLATQQIQRLQVAAGAAAQKADATKSVTRTTSAGQKVDPANAIRNQVLTKVMQAVFSPQKGKDGKQAPSMADELLGALSAQIFGGKGTAPSADTFGAFSQTPAIDSLSQTSMNTNPLNVMGFDGGFGSSPLYGLSGLDLSAPPSISFGTGGLDFGGMSLGGFSLPGTGVPSAGDSNFVDFNFSPVDLFSSAFSSTPSLGVQSTGTNFSNFYGSTNIPSPSFSTGGGNLNFGLGNFGGSPGFGVNYSMSF